MWLFTVSHFRLWASATKLRPFHSFLSFEILPNILFSRCLSFFLCFFSKGLNTWTFTHFCIPSMCCENKGSWNWDDFLREFKSDPIDCINFLIYWLTVLTVWLFCEGRDSSFTWIYYCIYLLTFPILRLGWIKISLHAIDLLRKNTMAKRLFSQPFTIHFIYPRTLS